jgi:hypothetical protein
VRGRAFAGLLQQVVGNLETMQAGARLRWLDLLWYLQALVYHDRAPVEHQELDRVIQASLRTDEHRQELSMARRTIAEALREEGEQREAIRSRQQLLIRALRGRFGEVPPTVERLIEGSRDISQLETWFDSAVKAKTLADVKIPATE